MALDMPRLEDALAYLRLIGGDVCWVKVGLELFASEGPDAVRMLAARDLRVFLDLKLHDIPTTVARAAARLGEAGCAALNVHALGGGAMIAAASEALRPHGTLLLAVTVLTSHDEAGLAEIGLTGPIPDAAGRLAALAREAGAGGVVASGREAAAIRGAAPKGFHIVVPGIRRAEDAANDQRRPTTAALAVAAGADQVVLGRSLSGAPDPSERFREFVREVEAAERAPHR